MSEPRLPLEQLLAEEAERAVPADLDLWPGVSQRLRALGFAGGETATAIDIVEARPATQRRAARTPRRGAVDGWRKPGEFLGNVISFGLGALAIAIVAIIVGLPSRGEGSPGFGAGTPEQANGARSTAATIGDDTALGTPDQVVETTVDCTFELDVSPETRADRVVIPIRASANGSCGNASALRVAIVDQSGKRTPISGSPLTVPLKVDDEERRAEVSVVWTNWCGTTGQYRIETQFGSERHTLPLPAAPRCVDQERPSTLHLQMIETGAASATPATPDAQGTPIP